MAPPCRTSLGPLLACFSEEISEPALVLAYQGPQGGRMSVWAAEGAGHCGSDSDSDSSTNGMLSCQLESKTGPDRMSAWGLEQKSKTTSAEKALSDALAGVGASLGAVAQQVTRNLCGPAQAGSQPLGPVAKAAQMTAAEVGNALCRLGAEVSTSMDNAQAGFFLATLLACTVPSSMEHKAVVAATAPSSNPMLRGQSHLQLASSLENRYFGGSSSDKGSKAEESEDPSGMVLEGMKELMKQQGTPTAGIVAFGQDGSGTGKPSVAADDLYWARRFQEVTRMSNTSSRQAAYYVACGALAAEFTKVAEMYVRVLVTERHLPVTSKSIKPVNAGGIAGGDKFMCAGIFFKWAVAGPLFNDSSAAARAARHDLRSINAVMDLLPGDMQPIEGSGTLVYGSDDGGVTVLNTCPLADRACRGIAKALNLKSHLVGGEEIALCGDAEVHRGTDGGLYLLDLARLFPCQAQPDSVGQMLAHRLRPELVRMPGVPPLCADAFSQWDDSPPEMREASKSDVVRAQELVMTKQIPALAAHLDSLDDGLYPNLSVLCHSEGINMRMLGHVLDHLTQPHARRVLVTEMSARVAKATFFDVLRSISRQYHCGGLSLDSLDEQVTCVFLNTLFDSAGRSPPGNHMWSVLKQRVSLKYGQRAAAAFAGGDRDIRDDIWWKQFFDRLTSLGGIQLGIGNHAERCLEAGPFPSGSGYGGEKSFVSHSSYIKRAGMVTNTLDAVGIGQGHIHLETALACPDHTSRLTHLEWALKALANVTTSTGNTVAAFELQPRVLLHWCLSALQLPTVPRGVFHRCLMYLGETKVLVETNHSWPAGVIRNLHDLERSVWILLREKYNVFFGWDKEWHTIDGKMKARMAILRPSALEEVAEAASTIPVEVKEFSIMRLIGAPEFRSISSMYTESLLLPETLSAIRESKSALTTGTVLHQMLFGVMWAAVNLREILPALHMAMDAWTRFTDLSKEMHGVQWVEMTEPGLRAIMPHIGMFGLSVFIYAGDFTRADYFFKLMLDSTLNRFPLTSHIVLNSWMSAYQLFLVDETSPYSHLLSSLGHTVCQHVPTEHAMFARIFKMIIAYTNPTADEDYVMAFYNQDTSKLGKPAINLMVVSPLLRIGTPSALARALEVVDSCEQLMLDGRCMSILPLAWTWKARVFLKMTPPNAVLATEYAEKAVASAADQGLGLIELGARTHLVEALSLLHGDDRLKEAIDNLESLDSNLRSRAAESQFAGRIAQSLLSTSHETISQHRHV